MTEILNWIGAISIILGFGLIGFIGFKRSAWWGSAKGVMDELDLFEMRIVKIAFAFLIASFLAFILANI